MNLVKIITSLIGLIIIVVVGWMNITPGYFRLSGCPCAQIVYRVDTLEFPCPPGATYTLVECKRGWFDGPLLFLAKLDFKK